jgi:CheY-like chemotaxis protein
MARVLIAASSDEVRQAAVGALSEAGHDVEHVASGGEALARLAVSIFDVVITDFAVRGLSGIDLLKALRSASPLIKVVAYAGTGGDVSANTMLLAAQAFGADRILYLPFSRGEILAAVAALSA